MTTEICVKQCRIDMSDKSIIPELDGGNKIQVPRELQGKNDLIRVFSINQSSICQVDMILRIALCITLCYHAPTTPDPEN